MREHEQGFYIIKPVRGTGSTPLTCPVCQYLMFDISDANMYQKFQCCNFCALRWAQANSVKWATGWRPSSDDIITAIEEKNAVSF
jgi:hypothetical protein